MEKLFLGEVSNKQDLFILKNPKFISKHKNEI